MKKVIAVLFLGLVLQVNSQTEISKHYDKIGKFKNGIAIVQSRGLFGAINTEGKEVIKPEWDRLSGFGEDGIAYARKNGLVGLITKDGTVLAEPVYNRIGTFTNGKAVVLKNGLKGIMEISGKVVIEPKYDNLKIEEGGLIRAQINGQEVLLKL